MVKVNHLLLTSASYLLVLSMMTLYAIPVCAASITALYAQHQHPPYMPLTCELCLSVLSMMTLYASTYAASALLNTLRFWLK